MKNIFIFLLINVIFSSTAFAGTVYKEGTVTSLKMFGDVFVIYVDAIDTPACATGQKRVAIKNDDPIYSTVVSAALTAKATGAKIQIGYNEQCVNNSTSWDFESFWLI